MDQPSPAECGEPSWPDFVLNGRHKRGVVHVPRDCLKTYCGWGWSAALASCEAIATEKFKFRTSIGQFGFQTELTADSERVVRSTFELKLNGYLVPQTRQNDLNSIKKFSKASKVSFNVETASDIDDI